MTTALITTALADVTTRPHGFEKHLTTLLFYTASLQKLSQADSFLELNNVFVWYLRRLYVFEKYDIPGVHIMILPKKTTCCTSVVIK